MGSWDPAWDEVFAGHEWGKYPPEYVVRFVARAWYGAKVRAATRLLDLGSGPGSNSWYMAREGFTVSAIDGSERAVNALRSRLLSEGLTVDARVGDFISLPWPDDWFDGVIDNLSICHNPFEESKRVMAEVRRVLKDDGRFLSAGFSDRSWGFGTGRKVEPGGFSDIAEGPCAGKGFCRFMDRKQLDLLFTDFGRTEIDKMSWTLDEMSHTVEIWVVKCLK